MNKILHTLAIAALLTVTLSCGNRKAQNAASETASDTISVFDRIPVADKAFMLSEQKLTSEEALMKVFYGKDDEYYSEITSAEEAFFFPEADLGSTPLVKTVRERYNLAAVLNRVVCASEIFKRLSFEVDEADENTRADTLKWVKATQPALSDTFVERALEGAPQSALKSARSMLAAYRTFVGDDSEGSNFYLAFRNLAEEYNALPEIVSEEQVRQFEDSFWEWYDKAQYVPEIDDLIRPHLYESTAPKPDSLQTGRLHRAVMGEKDINRRAILALELVQYDRRNGALLLGDIIESGLYTPYLLEVWLSWRANVQMEHSPSSFSVIANNYYDKMRVKCLNTLLRHCQEQDDVRVRCLLENMIVCEPIHRQGSLAGNESFTTCMYLAYEMFIHPRLLEE